MSGWSVASDETGSLPEAGAVPEAGPAGAGLRPLRPLRLPRPPH